MTLTIILIVVQANTEETVRQEVERPLLGDVNEELKSMSGTQDISSTYSLQPDILENVKTKNIFYSVWN